MIAGLLCSSALAIWLFHFYVWYQYDGTRPLRSDALSGRVYPLNTHGHVVYLNKEEDARLTRLTIVAVSLFGIGGLIEGLFASGFVASTKAWEKKQW
jgi:hypothetical protein